MRPSTSLRARARKRARVRPCARTCTCGGLWRLRRGIVEPGADPHTHTQANFDAAK